MTLDEVFAHIHSGTEWTMVRLTDRLDMDGDGKLTCRDILHPLKGRKEKKIAALVARSRKEARAALDKLIQEEQIMDKAAQTAYWLVENCTATAITAKNLAWENRVQIAIVGAGIGIAATGGIIGIPAAAASGLAGAGIKIARDITKQVQKDGISIKDSTLQHITDPKKIGIAVLHGAAFAATSFAIKYLASFKGGEVYFAEASNADGEIIEKIGMTTRSAAERLKEHAAATGLDIKLKEVFSTFDPKGAESALLAKINGMGTAAMKGSREWFAEIEAELIQNAFDSIQQQTAAGMAATTTAIGGVASNLLENCKGWRWLPWQRK